MNSHNDVLAVARVVAVALLNGQADVEHFQSGGRNSRIYRVRCDGREFALKQYPSATDDPRDRLGTEVGALTLMESIGIDVVPRVLAVDRVRNFALMGWIEGTPIDAVGDSDLDQAIAFLKVVRELRSTPGNQQQPAAAEACLSGQEIERQIGERLTRLAALPRSEAALHAFLSESFTPVFRNLIGEAKAGVRARGIEFSKDIPETSRNLVPSDFGFHNSVRRPDGSLAFLDFEYFGWDDPVKLTADVLLHPGWPLNPQQQLRFRQGAEKLYSAADPDFAARLASYLPLFGLRWTLILLNEFMPERWERRILAGATESWDEAKTRQLRRAKDMLAAVAGNRI
jgi:hypothetical protein